MNNVAIIITPISGMEIDENEMASKHTWL